MPIATAPTNGPTKFPIRFTPPSVDSERPRRFAGITSLT